MVLGAVVASAAALFEWRRRDRWPGLPTAHFVRGRAATAHDVESGDAAFALERGDEFVGEPVSIAIPQYAWYFERETRTWHRVVVIQAERAPGPGGTTWYGVRVHPEGRGGIPALDIHVILLGPAVPRRALMPTQVIPDQPYRPRKEDWNVSMIIGGESQ